MGCGWDVKTRSGPYGLWGFDRGPISVLKSPVASHRIKETLQHRAQASAGHTSVLNSWGGGGGKSKVGVGKAFTRPLNHVYSFNDTFFFNLLATPRGTWDLAPRPGIESHPLYWQRRISTTGPPRKFQYIPILSVDRIGPPPAPSGDRAHTTQPPGHTTSPQTNNFNFFFFKQEPGLQAFCPSLVPHV